jgi:uncharacterized protein YihD (DUF1040 family)
MSQEIENNVEIEETTEDEVEETEDEEVEGDEYDYEAELETKNKKIKELEDLIARKKKEQKRPEKNPPVQVPNTELSQRDLYTLIKHDVHEDDIDEVVEYANLKKIKVEEALKSSVIKAILKDKEETRKTAEVSNTGTVRKGATPKDVDSLVAKAKNGDFPQSEEDMKKVFLRMKGLDK